VRLPYGRLLARKGDMSVLLDKHLGLILVRKILLPTHR
jgi:hypothetical protein